MYFKTSNSKLYYRIIGKGKPLVFLHGNNEDSSTFEGLIPHLEQQYQIILIDTPLHGKSESSIAVNYINFAKEIAIFINGLGLDNPIIIGYSDGGIIALHISILRLAKISAIILLGANYLPQGLKQNAQKAIAKEVETLTGARQKIASLMLNSPHITPQQLATIDVPTLVIAGDRDLIKKKHTISLSKMIKHAELFIVSNSGHFTVNKIDCIDKIKQFIINIR